MRVYVPYCEHANELFEWTAGLGAEKKFHAIGVVDKTKHHSLVNRDLLNQIFCSVDVITWNESIGLDNAWEACAVHAYKNNTGEPWMMWPSDRIPLHKGWLEQIRDAYWTKKPGSIGLVEAQDRFPGFGVFNPLSWAIVKLVGRDPKVDERPDLFQTLRTDAQGWSALAPLLDFKCATVWSTNLGLTRTLLNHRNSTAVNVPNHLPDKMHLYEPKLNPVPGTVDIVIVTFAKDFPWLKYCLTAIKKFATGFRQVLVVVPEEDAHAVPLISRWDLPLRVLSYKDTPGKGFLVHAEKICEADLLTDADYSVCLDADCVMKEPNDAGHYFSEDGKPIAVYRSYESLKSADGKVVSDCYQWKGVSEATLGMPLTTYHMCRHPAVYPREIFAPFRQCVEKVHGLPFHDYMIAGRNSFPQDRAEHPSLGGFAWEKFHDLFSWVNCEHSAPRDLLRAFWSHGGIDQHVGEHWFDARATSPHAKKDQTARQLIEGWLA